jgi:Protein of unknown function (DUF2950)
MSVNVKVATAIIATAVLVSAISALGQEAPQGQKSFPTARAAIHALAAAVRAGNQPDLLAIFGPEGKELVSSGDPNEDKQGLDTFVQKYDQMHRLVKEPDGNVTLYLGAENWPFPIPLVEKSGAWYFDTAAGKEEVLFRRIGRNELSTIDVCQELVKAEKEHFAGAHPGEAGEYAQKFSADQGEHNGLYHPVTNGQPEIGPLLAEASADRAGQGESAPFHGYYYRILTRQGKRAPGGAQNYVVDGKMTKGFAFVAFPAQYKSSGVMTFIVNQDGVVYQKDLGPNTDSLARAIQEYNPDSSWKKAEEDK